MNKPKTVYEVEYDTTEDGLHVVTSSKGYFSSREAAESMMVFLRKGRTVARIIEHKVFDNVQQMDYYNDDNIRERALKKLTDIEKEILGL